MNDLIAISTQETLYNLYFYRFVSWALALPRYQNDSLNFYYCRYIRRYFKDVLSK